MNIRYEKPYIIVLEQQITAAKTGRKYRDQDLITTQSWTFLIGLDDIASFRTFEHSKNNAVMRRHGVCLEVRCLVDLKNKLEREN